MSKPLAASDQEQLTLLYQVTTADLAYFKTQQWSVANYALLLQAAVFGLHQVVANPVALEKTFLALLSAIVAVMAVLVLRKLEESLAIRQARLDAARQSFGPAFQSAWAAQKKKPERFHSIWFLYGAVAVAPIVVGWLILRISA